MDPKVLTQADSEENLNIHVDHIAICVHSMVNARHHNNLDLRSKFSYLIPLNQNNEISF